MRILADLPDEDVKWLDRLAQEQGKSRAAVLREAVSSYRVHAGHDSIESFFGMWQDRPDIIDGLAYQDRLRSEWDRDQGATDE